MELKFWSCLEAGIGWDLSRAKGSALSEDIALAKVSAHFEDLEFRMPLSLWFVNFVVMNCFQTDLFPLRVHSSVLPRSAKWPSSAHASVYPCPPSPPYARLAPIRHTPGCPCPPSGWSPPFCNSFISRRSCISIVSFENLPSCVCREPLANERPRAFCRRTPPSAAFRCTPTAARPTHARTRSGSKCVALQVAYSAAN